MLIQVRFTPNSRDYPWIEGLANEFTNCTHAQAVEQWLRSIYKDMDDIEATKRSFVAMHDNVGIVHAVQTRDVETDVVFNHQVRINASYEITHIGKD